MSKEQHSPIRFQLEESLWLDHHANAAEITSLELEPEVEVIEDSDLITIRGSLVLTGRFEPTEEDEEESLDLESSSLAEQLHFQPLRVEQKEIYQREHRGKIEKRFPVDVTVPMNKIDRLDDVFIQIEQFDYTVSEGHRLNIQAEVAISGIRSEARKDVVLEKKEGEIRADSIEKFTPSPSMPLSFDVAAAKDELPEDEDELPEHDDERAFESETVEEHEGTRTVTVEENQENIELTYEHEAEKDHESSYTDESREAMDDSDTEQNMENESDEKVVSLFDQVIRTRFNSLPPDHEQDVSEDEDEEESGLGSKTTSFLTQLMSGRDEGGPDYTKLKMCIIQRNESLEEVAQRYEIKSRDIMKFNRLDTEQVSEGQIIYIPKS
jgi:stage VI sporulation protein D